MAAPKRHVLVCTQVRPAGGQPSCGGRGSTEIAAALHRALAKDPVAVAEIAVTATACLGPCFDGPTVVVYPEAVWYVGVTVADVDELVESHLLGGRPVRRLLREEAE